MFHSLRARRNLGMRTPRHSSPLLPQRTRRRSPPAPQQLGTGDPSQQNLPESNKDVTTAPVTERSTGSGARPLVNGSGLRGLAAPRGHPGAESRKMPARDTLHPILFFTPTAHQLLRKCPNDATKPSDDGDAYEEKPNKHHQEKTARAPTRNTQGLKRVGPQRPRSAHGS